MIFFSCSKFCNFIWFFSIVVGIHLVTAAAAQEATEPGDIEPAPISLTTKDGVKLAGMYYCTEESKETIPVVFLHDYKGNYHTFDQVARQLQQGPPNKEGSQDGPGIAALTIDLRGHGGSTRQTFFNGQSVELDASKFKPQDIMNMVRFDMEAVRKYLVDKNDEGKLNLNKLCLVGAGMGATVAASWTAVDWRAPPLATTKQGQDVKGLVLVSPEQVFMGIRIHDALRMPGVRDRVSVLIICGGQDSKAEREAKRIFKILEPYHPEPPENERQEKQDLFFQELSTSNQGGKLFEPPSLGIEGFIAEFIELRLVKKDHEWLRRRYRR